MVVPKKLEDAQVEEIFLIRRYFDAVQLISGEWVDDIKHNYVLEDILAITNNDVKFDHND